MSPVQTPSGEREVEVERELLPGELHGAGPVAGERRRLGGPGPGGEYGRENE